MTHRWDPTEAEQHEFSVHTDSMEFFEGKTVKKSRKKKPGKEPNKRRDQNIKN